MLESVLRKFAHSLRDTSRRLRRFRHPKAQPPRKVAFFELSNICNAACIFCSYPAIAASGKPLRHMEQHTFEKALALAISLGYRRLGFTPTTGEILANPRWSDYLALALNHEDVGSIYFYSNAILLKDSNIDKLLRLPRIDKLEGLYFSVGGTDAKTYRLMFGVDKFEVVKRNINALCHRLKQEGRTIPVHCEARVPKDSIIGEQAIIRTFNEAGYRYFHGNALKQYDPLGGLISRTELAYLPDIPNKMVPCYRLQDLRFDALDRVWMCGCVVSERLNDESLLVGSLSSTADDIRTEQTRVFDRWSQGQLPEVCATCRVYKPTAV